MASRLDRGRGAGCVGEHNAKRRLIPHELVSATTNGATPFKAWRMHFGLKQLGVAARMNIGQAAYAYLER